MRKNKIFKFALEMPIAAIILLLANVFLIAKADAFDLRQQAKGKILLQVEKKGEGWYASANNGELYCLGNPHDAFAVMRELGMGISDLDLEKIPLGNIHFSGKDADIDGLADIFEDAVGTDKNNNDTDNDGYSDGVELLSGYDPKSAKKLIYQAEFAQKHKGKIFLQVERHGEAWYVYPGNYKRYFLGRPLDAWQIMTSLGLGISNENLARLPIRQSCKENLATGASPAITPAAQPPKEEPLSSALPEKSAPSAPMPNLNRTNYLTAGNILSFDNGKKVSAPQSLPEPDRPVSEFAKNFSACVSANSQQIAVMENTILNFTIIGLSGGYCEVKVNFIKAPLAAWLNKDMICKYNNGLDFAAASVDTSRCQGELANLILVK